jgi:hypothetical protein
MSTYYLCLYDTDKKLMAATRYACRGCALKRASKVVPCCLREKEKDGKVVWSNDRYKEVFKNEVP